MRQLMHNNYNMFTRKVCEASVVTVHMELTQVEIHLAGTVALLGHVMLALHSIQH